MQSIDNEMLPLRPCAVDKDMQLLAHRILASTRRISNAGDADHAAAAQRDWASLPFDVTVQVLVHLGRRPLAVMRQACKAWHDAVDGFVDRLDVRCWPQARAMARFVALQELSLKGPAIVSDEERIEVLAPLMLALASLPRLSSLDYAYAGPGSLENLDVLQSLTRLSLCRAHSPVSPRLTAAEADNDTLYLAGPLPVDALAHNVAAADDIHADNAAGLSRRHAVAWWSGTQGRVMLPQSLARLSLLAELRLCDIHPDYGLLRQMGSLRRLEMQGQTIRHGSSMLINHNPLVGVSALTQLTALVSKCNYAIARLPSDIGALTGLLELDLSKNMLWDVPWQISKLCQLRRLDLSSNCLSTAPEELGALTSLTYLDLSTNSRVALPHSLSCLLSLQHLCLNWVWADLGVLWAAASNLRCLHTLSAVGNGISELPESLGDFKAIRHLSLSMNNLAAIPASISRLTTLQNLEISDNQLREVPASMGALKRLTSLSMRSNHLARLPDTVGELGSLTFLDLSLNDIKVLPDSCSRLTSLEQLCITLNPVKALPPGLASLTRLRILEMYYVRLADATATARLAKAIPGLFIFCDSMLPPDPVRVHAGAALAAAAATAEGAELAEGAAGVESVGAADLDVFHDVLLPGQPDEHGEQQGDELPQQQEEQEAAGWGDDLPDLSASELVLAMYGAADQQRWQEQEQQQEEEDRTNGAGTSRSNGSDIADVCSHHISLGSGTSSASSSYSSAVDALPQLPDATSTAPVAAEASKHSNTTLGSGLSPMHQQSAAGTGTHEARYAAAQQSVDVLLAHLQECDARLADALQDLVQDIAPATAGRYASSGAGGAAMQCKATAAMGGQGLQQVPHAAADGAGPSGTQAWHYPDVSKAQQEMECEAEEQQQAEKADQQGQQLQQADGSLPVGFLGLEVSHRPLAGGQVTAEQPAAAQWDPSEEVDGGGDALSDELVGRWSSAYSKRMERRRAQTDD